MCSMAEKMKYSAKYVKLAKKTGCMKFKRTTGIETLDVPIKDSAALQYFLETSNWFLFEKDDEMLNLMEMYLR